MSGASPVFERIAGTKYDFGGWLGGYLTNVTERWVKVAPLSNPGMLQMFHDRDRRPLRNLVPWAGEFAGKYLTGAVLTLRCHRDPALKAFLAEFVDQLIACQDGDGYLGPWPADCRLTGWAPNTGEKGGHTWDAWGHYHVMTGLLLWYDQTDDPKALRCARKIGDLLCRKFLAAPAGKRLVDTGSTEMNMAPVHSLCVLHTRTGAEKYLRLAKQLVDEFAARGTDGPLAGDYLRTALLGNEFFQTPKPRWESLHPIMALAELHWITGEQQYRKAFEHVYWSILRGDRHNNGGFSTGERAVGDPYAWGAIETCCTIAWLAMSVEMLRMTGSSIVADEIELST
ncbi:MAG TPA: beta-L-arabinofuranosidase domain-containing protein, partial [Phycisphaerae bacterium]|nr:beta-L-arabinofuranosidase domain-containing protein [Phycisphaerae bacterium]